MPIRILAIGDIVGRRSVRYLGEQLRRLRDRLGADFTVVNGENAADIHGIAVQDAEAILEAGADLITLGNHAFGQRDIGHFLDDRPDRIIRPANFPAPCPGAGWTFADVHGRRMLCINLSGTVHMDELDNPFTVAERILAAEKGRYDIAMLDFHAEATSEKMAMGRFLDGRVQVVFGTHTHVATADEAILPGGTGSGRRRYRHRYPCGSVPHDDPDAHAFFRGGGSRGGARCAVHVGGRGSLFLPAGGAGGVLSVVRRQP